MAFCGVVAARYAALPGYDNRSALITVISSYPMWRDFAMSVNVAGTVSSSLGNEQERRSDEHDGGGEAMDAQGD